MTVCPVPGIDTFSSPKYIYPMCDLSYAFEVVGGDTSLTQMEQCGLHFNGTHPDISCTPLNLDGLALPYCDLEVSASNILQEFSFVVMFKPYSVIGTSTVIDYKYFGALQETREVVLFIDNGIITFRVLGPGGAETNYTSQLNMSVSIESGYWTYVAISKDYSLGKLEMAMKTDTPDVASTYVVTSGGEYFPSEMSLNVPGILRVGESHSGGMGNFVGEIICLNIFDTDGLADVKYYTEFVNGCNPPWNPPPTGMYIIHVKVRVYVN